jgi:hypothetical protein
VVADALDGQPDEGRLRQRGQRVGEQERVHLVPRAGPSSLRVTGGEQYRVGDQQADRPGSEPPVPAQQAILPEDLLDERDAAHQQHHQQG